MFYFLLPTGMDYRTRRYPVVTFTIMGLCTVVHLVTLFYTLGADNPKEAHKWIYEHLWLMPSESHWWTYITSMFVHGGIMHLLGNMIYLFLFGACVEDMIGRLHFTLFYLLSGIGAAFAYVMFSSEHFASDIPMGGASGAISACIGGYLLLRAKAKIEFKWVFIFWFRVWQGEFFTPAWVVISFWFLKDFGLMLLAASAKKSHGGVAFGAHVGGMLIGMGLIALEKIRLKRLPNPVDEDEDVPVITPVRPTTINPIPQPRAAARVIPLRTAASAAAPAPAPEPTLTPTPEPATIHLSSNGTQSGPFTPSQVQQMFASGEIPSDAFYWQEGMADWSSVAELRTPGAN